jgi:predicted nuclease of predicted toxin-antitoxin system
MKLYLDDDSADRLLMRLLQAEGYDFVTPSDVGLAGCADPIHLLYAIERGRCVLTANHDDFLQ